MSTHHFSGEEQSYATARAIFADVIKNPKLRQLIERALADERLDNRDIYQLGFEHGVLAALDSLAEGRLLVIPRN